MNKFLIAFALWASSSVAQAQCATDEPEPRRALISFQGREGLWFPMPIARCVLSEIEVLRATMRENELLLDGQRLRDQRIALLSSSVEITRGEASALALQLDEATQELERSRDFWKHPVLWFSVGLLLGVIAVGAVVIAI